MQSDSFRSPESDSGIDDVDELERTLLAYIASRPGACDTLHGICEWWIPPQHPRQARAEVLAALQRLESRGAIVSRVGIDGQARYAAPDADLDPPHNMS
jgi:hypothetical protein